MYKSLVSILIVVLLISGFSSCCKLACEGRYIFISLENYKRFEADTLIFLGYEQNTNFSILRDSTQYIIPNAANDSSAVTHSHSIYADKDWIIKVPSVNKQFKISGYETTDARCECGNKKYTVVRSFRVNGVEERSMHLKLPR